jgi:hypothetical protein
MSPPVVDVKILMVALLELTYATSIRTFEMGVAVEGEAVLKKRAVEEVTSGVVGQVVVVHLNTEVLPDAKTTS